MLSDKDRELVSIGASIAAACQPCAKFHLRAARMAGAGDAEISQAVNKALSVGRHAAEVMAQIGALHTEALTSGTGATENSLLGELVSISAACAANSIPDLDTHTAEARRLGATDGQILTAIKIAGAVKQTAERQVEMAAERAVGMTPGESEDCCH